MVWTAKVYPPSSRAFRIDMDTRMKRLRSNLFASLLSLTAALLFAIPQNVTSVLAEGDGKATTEIIHKPMGYFVPQKRIKIEATVTDKLGVNLVRCYFRALEQEDYVFVAMHPVFGSFEGILPAPSKETEKVQYLFLVVNGHNQVVTTQTFELRRKDKDETPAWQQVSPKGKVRVITELAQAPKTPAGFTDAIAMGVVESYSRFGFVVGGIYTAQQIARAGGAIGIAAAADDGGMVSAKKGRMSTLTYVGIGAALLAGGAVAAGGGGGGGGGGDGQPTTTSSTTSTTTVPPTTTSTTTAPTTVPTTTSTTTIPPTTTSSTTTVRPECTPPASWEAHVIPVCPHEGLPGSTLPYIVIVDVGTPDRLVFYRFSGGFVIQPRTGEGYQYSSAAGRITFGLSVRPVGAGAVTAYVEIAECEGRPHREWRLPYPNAFPPCD